MRGADYTDVGRPGTLSSQCKATVTPDRTIYVSYDWLRLGQGATDRKFMLRSPAAVAYRDRSEGEGCLYCTVAYIETGRFLENY